MSELESIFLHPLGLNVKRHSSCDYFVTRIFLNPWDVLIGQRVDVWA